MTEFKKFRVGDLFEVIGSNVFKTDYLGEVDVIRAQSLNNGVASRIVGSANLLNGITIGMRGSFNAFVHDRPFIIGDNVAGFWFKGDSLLSTNSMLYIATCLNKLYEGFSGYENYPTFYKLNNDLIELPVTIDGSPDWQEMESVVDTVEQQHVDTVDKTLSAAGFRSYDDTLLTKEEESLLKEWSVVQTKSERNESDSVSSSLPMKLFKISELFEVVNRGDISNQKKLIPDKNGVLLLLQGNDSFLKKYLQENHKVFEASDENVYLGIGRQTGSVSILSNDFMTTDGVLVLGPIQNMNVAIYIKTMLLKTLKNISYSNTLSASDLYERELYIPVDHRDVINIDLLNDLVNIFKKLSIRDLRQSLDEQLSHYQSLKNL